MAYISINKMKSYEIIHQVLAPFNPFYFMIRNDLKRITSGSKSNLKICDIGGRKSQYTIGVNANVTLVDKPPDNQIQKDLNLGLDKTKIESLESNRSNIDSILIHDITKPLEQFSNYFDVVLLIEVFEHIELDKVDDVLNNIKNILKPNGILYMTQPNGDFVKNEPPNYNPDHKKHYKKIELKNILGKYFTNVKIHYAMKISKYRTNSQRSWDIKRPILLLSTWVSSIISVIESRSVKNNHKGTAHLVSFCQKEK